MIHVSYFCITLNSLPTDFFLMEWNHEVIYGPSFELSRKLHMYVTDKIQLCLQKQLSASGIVMGISGVIYEINM